MILTEELTYPGFRHSARLLRARLVGVAMDADGLRPEAPFVWLRLPGGWRMAAFQAACRARGVLLRGADVFAVPGGPVPDAVRLSLNLQVPRGRVIEGLRRIDEILNAPPPVEEI